MEVASALPYRAIGLGRLYYEATGVTPHSETTRATYTVVANTYCYVWNSLLFVKRNTAATVAGTFGAKFQVLIGGTEIILVNVVHSTSNTVGAYDKMIVPLGIWLRPGDMIRVTTFDTSTGGTVDYTLFAGYLLSR